MNDLDLPGWELDHIPADPNVICQTWLEHYANGEPLSPDQIQFLVDRALIHADVLEKAILHSGGSEISEA
jgi:hypothetical protein